MAASTLSTGAAGATTSPTELAIGITDALGKECKKSIQNALPISERGKRKGVSTRAERSPSDDARESAGTTRGQGRDGAKVDDRRAQTSATTVLTRKHKVREHAKDARVAGTKRATDNRDYSSRLHVARDRNVCHALISQRGRGSGAVGTATHRSHKNKRQNSRKASQARQQHGCLPPLFCLFPRGHTPDDTAARKAAISRPPVFKAVHGTCETNSTAKHSARTKASARAITTDKGLCSGGQRLRPLRVGSLNNESGCETIPETIFIVCKRREKGTTRLSSEGIKCFRDRMSVGIHLDFGACCMHHVESKLASLRL